MNLHQIAPPLHEPLLEALHERYGTSDIPRDNYEWKFETTTPGRIWWRTPGYKDNNWENDDINTWYRICGMENPAP